MYILDDFWYGNIQPNENGFRRGSEYARAMEKLCAAEDELRGNVPADILPLLDTFENAQLNAGAEAEMAGFIHGFRIGVRMMLDVLGVSAGRPTYS